jgi:nucleoid-associated protein YgaU
MPKKKRTIIARKKNQEKTVFSLTKKLRTFRWGESYTSLLLGIVAIIVVILFVGSLIKEKHTKDISSTSITPIATSTVNPQEPSSLVTLTPSTTQMQEKQVYTVLKGDDLWHIAEKVYNNGYAWTAIARENHLDNPGLLFAGTKLVIPTLPPTPTIEPTKTPTIQQEMQSVGPAITTNTYTVEHGDNLWNIAVRAYQDGYKWPDIAKANSLEHPNLIHSGNILKIPR